MSTHLYCLVSFCRLAFFLSRASSTIFGVSSGSLNASTASLARPLMYQGREQLNLSLVKTIWWRDSPEVVDKSWWAWMPPQHLPKPILLWVLQVKLAQHLKNVPISQFGSAI